MLLALVACAGPGHPPSGAVPVAAGTMLDLLSGNTLDGMTAGDVAVRIHVLPDRTVRLRVAAPRRPVYRDAGRVRADGDALCWRYEDVRDGNEVCQRYLRDGDRFWTSPRGQGSALLFTIAPGNPFGL